MISTDDSNLPAQLFENFVRTYPHEFSIKTARDFFIQNGYSFEIKALSKYIYKHPLIFNIKEGLCISRAALFTNKKFSIKPSIYEIKKGFLIPGHRTMPFTDPNQLPDELEFFVNGQIVPKKILTLPRSKILPAYALFGEEYSSQIILYDSANKEKGISDSGFELTNLMSVTVLDFSKWFKKWNFGIKDRLELKVIDWNLGFISVSIHKNTSNNIFEQTNLEKQQKIWYSNFKMYLRNSIEKYGACKSIEQQLAYTYFLANQNLFVDSSGSVEEFLRSCDSFSIQAYGVESRILINKETIPIFKNWFEIFDDYESNDKTLFSDIEIPIPRYMLDAYILDSIYLKRKDSTKIMERIIPENWHISNNKKASFLLFIDMRYKMLHDKYNFFSDFEIGQIRHSAVLLYSDMLSLFCDLKVSNIPIKSFSDYALVIMKQIFMHISQLVEALLFQLDINQKDLKAASLSIEGLQYSCEEINDILQHEIENHCQDKFKLLQRVNN